MNPTSTTPRPTDAELVKLLRGVADSIYQRSQTIDSGKFRVRDDHRDAMLAAADALEAASAARVRVDVTVAVLDEEGR